MTSSVVSHYATAAIDTLMEVANSPTAMSSARVQAARAILDEVRFQELNEAVTSKPTDPCICGTPEDTRTPPRHNVVVRVEGGTSPGAEDIYRVYIDGVEVTSLRLCGKAVATNGWAPITNMVEDIVRAVAP